LLDVDDTAGPSFKGKPQAAKLLRRLLDAGLSEYEPDPIRALAAADKLQRLGSTIVEANTAGRAVE
jgi:hypothetical protein